MKDQLKLITAWETEPALTEDDLDAVLASAALEDINGLAPAHEEWSPTYDLNAAASAAWLIKAARASSVVDIDPESGLAASRVFQNCRSMARLYASKRLVRLTIV